MQLRTYPIKDFATQHGVTLDLTLVYTISGAMNAAKSNCILIVTSYSATHVDAQDLIVESDNLSLQDYCVITINMLSNSESSSPSNTPAPFNGANFPAMTVHDNVRCQHQLITQELGIQRLRLVMGFSMGGLQTFEWGAQHSDMVDAILPICGAAKISEHNWMFLEGAKSALQADQKFAAGHYSETPEAGMNAFATVYSGWVFSQAFFREQLYKTIGLDNLDDVVGFMKAYFFRREANDLLGMLHTWQLANIANNDQFNGDFPAALAAISAKAIVLPSRSDLYFRIADSEYEVSQMPNAQLRVIESKMGHIAGGGMDPIGKEAIDRAINDLLKV